jgi:hypothetical protein
MRKVALRFLIISFRSVKSYYICPVFEEFPKSKIYKQQYHHV